MFRPSAWIVICLLSVGAAFTRSCTQSANALAAKEAAAFLKASQEAAALAEAQAQKEAAEAARAAELTDLMSALDEFSDHDKKLQAQGKDLLRSPSSSSTLEPPSGGGRGHNGRKRTPPPAISPPGNYYLGALTVRLRRTPPSAAARQREAKRRAKKRKQDAALPEVVSTSIFGDSDDSVTTLTEFAGNGQLNEICGTPFREVKRVKPPIAQNESAMRR